MFRVESMTRQELESLVSPKQGYSEAIPADLFQVRTYTSGTTSRLAFFTGAPANPQEGNVQNGQLPVPQYFQIASVHFDVLQPPNAANMRDVFQLKNGDASVLGRPTWTFTLANKDYGPYPLAGLGPSGGVKGHFTTTGQEQATGGEPSLSGWYTGGLSLTIPPQQSFSLTVDWPSVLTLNGGDTNVSAVLRGVLHRRIV